MGSGLKKNPANPNLDDIFGDTDLDFEIKTIAFQISGFSISSLGRAWALGDGIQHGNIYREFYLL